MGDQAGQRDAEFAAFMAADAGALLHTAWLLCGDAHRAEELAQQALVSTYVAWSRARETEPLAYARRSLANARIDGWRRRRREVLTSVDDVLAAAGQGHEAQVVERARLVAALLARLRVLLDDEGDGARACGHDVGATDAVTGRRQP